MNGEPSSTQGAELAITMNVATEENAGLGLALLEKAKKPPPAIRVAI